MKFRTMVCFLGLSGSEVVTNLPGWNPHKNFLLPLNEVPKENQSSLKSFSWEGGEVFRAYAVVDLSAEDPTDLQFEEWENPPQKTKKELAEVWTRLKESGTILTHE